MLANFDAPSREECIASRTVANTPQQALTLLNDPNFVEAARALARSALATGAGPERPRPGSTPCSAGRSPAPPSDREAASLLRFLEHPARGDPADPAAARRLVGPAPAPRSTRSSGPPGPRSAASS